MKFTPQQQTAIDHKQGALLVSAAAGSGKTAVLVERTVQLLCREENPVSADRLLIVTFTRAAASSLRAKLARRLEAELEQRPGSAHLRRQRMLLQRAAICTIDAYCLKLVQENFNLLDIPPDFSTADSAVLEDLRSQSLSDALENAYNDPDFCAFADLYGKGRTDQQAAQVVSDLHDFLTGMPRPAEALKHFCECWEEDKPFTETLWGKALLARAKEYADCALDLTEENLNDTVGDEDLANYLPALESDREQAKAIRDAVVEGSWENIQRLVRGAVFERLKSVRGYEGSLTDIIKERRALYKKIIGLLDEKVFVCTEEEFKADRAAAAPLVAALARTERDFDRRFMAAKMEEKMLEFSDVEQLALRLLQSPDGSLTPLALEARERFDAVMVDEYQDTNALQDALYACLSKEGGSDLLMVGDLKQSIYGFRQAEPGIFSQKLQEYAPYGEGGRQKLFLDANFRSAPGVIRGINALFEPILTPGLGGVTYGDGERLRPGFGETLEDYGGYEGGCELLIAEGSTEEEAAAIAKKIREMLTGGLTVRDGEEIRPVRFEDFCILLRSRKHFGTYADALENLGIPVYVDRSQNILTAPEVLPMASLLRVLDNPSQDVHLAAVMVQLGGFDPDDLARIRLSVPKGSFYGAVKAAGDEKTNEFIRRVDRLRALAQTLPADRLMEELFLATGWLAAVGAMPDGPVRRENLRRFAAFVADNDRTGLSGAVRAMDAAAQKGVQGPEQGQTKPGCVTIMTVHRSKGLEFPVVFAAGLSHPFNAEDARAQALMHRQLGLGLTLRAEGGGTYETLPYLAVQAALGDDSQSEEMRVLYVALTRARDRLVLSMSLKNPDKTLKKMGCLLGCRGVIEEPVLKMSHNAGDWVLASALTHPQAVTLRAAADSLFPPRMDHRDEPFEFEIERLEADEEPGEALPEQEETFEAAPVDEELLEQVRQRMAWQYPGEALEKTPAKVSVTSLVHAEKEVLLDRPSFLYGEGLTSAERGTAIHAFLQYANWHNAREDLDAELERQLNKKLLMPELGDKLDQKALRVFLESPTMKRILSAEKEYREYDYITAARLAGPDGGETLIQGVADLVLEFADHIEILDYKTDRHKTAEKLLSDYRPQLLLYARAIGRRFKKPIGKLTIYSFWLGRELDVPLERPDETILEEIEK